MPTIVLPFTRWTDRTVPDTAVEVAAAAHPLLAMNLQVQKQIHSIRIYIYIYSEDDLRLDLIHLTATTYPIK